MLCVVVYCCVNLLAIKNCLTATFFVISAMFCVVHLVDRSSNFVEFARQQFLAKCSANLTTPHKNNMQRMVTKCCVLLGEKLGSFDWGINCNYCIPKTIRKLLEKTVVKALH